MHTLSMTTGYAVQALSILAQKPDSFMLVRDIAKSAGIAAPYLAKIMQRLVDSGLLDSKRGYRGGVRMLFKPEEISILHINDAVELVGSKPHCLLGVVECSDERDCPVHQYWKTTRDQIAEKLGALTLADMVEFELARPAGTKKTPKAAAPKKAAKKGRTSKAAAPKKAAKVVKGKKKRG